MALPPTKPVSPSLALRSVTENFVANTEAWIAYQANGLPTYIDDSNNYVQTSLEAMYAVAYLNDLPPLTGNGGLVLSANGTEDGLEFTDTVTDLVLNGTVTGTAKASTANAEAGTGVGLMDATLTKAAIDARVGGEYRNGEPTASTFRFYNIPSTATEITVHWDNLGVNTGSAAVYVDLGVSPDFEPSPFGSTGAVTVYDAGVITGSTNSRACLGYNLGVATRMAGQLVFKKAAGVSRWSWQGMSGGTGNTLVNTSGMSGSYSGPVDRVRFSASTGTFAAGAHVGVSWR